METSPSNRPKRRLYGRHRVHRLSKHQERLYKELLPKISVPLGTPLPKELFGRTGDVVVEIGFGDGENLAWMAKQHRDKNFIGCEPYVNGVAKLAVEIHDNQLSNVRIFQGDARDMLDALAPDTVSEMFVLFPDPWPKRRHRKRRLISSDTADTFASVLEKGGKLTIATDVDEYAAWVVRHIGCHPRFAWTAASAADWRSSSASRPETKYELKAKAAGRRCSYLTYVRT